MMSLRIQPELLSVPPLTMVYLLGIDYFPVAKGPPKKNLIFILYALAVSKMRVPWRAHKVWSKKSGLVGVWYGVFLLCAS